MENIMRLHSLIERGNTGSSLEIADLLGISKRTVQAYLSDLKMYGADIEYDKIQKTYYYKNGFVMEFHLKFFIKNNH